MKTSELTGAALDYAVALIEYPEWKDQGFLECLADLEFDDGTAYSPSTDWSQGGPIIEREGITLRNYIMGDQWDAEIDLCEGDFMRQLCSGQTPLIAAMRCYVASKLGDDVDVPEELT